MKVSITVRLGLGLGLVSLTGKRRLIEGERKGSHTLGMKVRIRVRLGLVESAVIPHLVGIGVRVRVRVIEEERKGSHTLELKVMIRVRLGLGLVESEVIPHLQN
jgi:hypothetical protein